MRRGGIVASAERWLATGALRLPPSALRRLAGAPVRSPEGYTLDLQVHALLRLARLRREPEDYGDDLVRARRRFDRRATLLDRPRGPSVRVVDREVPGAEGPRACRVYLPNGVTDRPAPGLVWFHGGGFVLGSIASHDGVCAAIAERAGVVVVSVDYRLAPEHRFPGGLDDAVAATRWVLEHGGDIGIAPDAVAIGGDSAGGNFAAAASQALRGDLRRPILQVLVYPATDATCREASHRHFRSGFILTAENIAWFLGHYLPAADFAWNPGVSPLLAPDVSSLPPAFVLTAGFDPLRDEGRHYARRMREAGVDVEEVCGEGSIHGFLNMAGVVDEAGRLVDRVAAEVRRRLVPAAR